MPTSPLSPLVVEELLPAERTLRVAFVTETWPPEVNGVAMTVARVVDGLQRRRHEVQLLRPRQAAESTPATEPAGPLLHEVLMRGLPIPRYPHLRMGMPCKRELVQRWSQQRPDVVHVATEGPLGWSALHAARHLKLPVTSDFRTNFHAYSRHYGIGWLRGPIMGYLRRFHNAAAVTMVPTEPLRRELEGAGFRHVRVVARGVDCRRFAPTRRSHALRAAWGVAEGDLVVACVGRLAPEKNLEVLVRAYQAIHAADARARLLLVGDGPMRDVLAARLPGAILAGSRHGDDLPAHYASADLFLFPSLTETFGNVTTEAMASGLPVVAFDYAAAAQMIRPGEQGVLVPFGDGDEFVRAAVALSASRACRQAMGEAARRRALVQDWDSVISRFEAELWLATRRPPPQAAVWTATTAA
mgnify:CR=1 FL=1